MKERLLSLLVTVVSAVATTVVFYYVATLFHSKQPMFIALALIGSMLLHEIGHMAVLEKMGIRTHMVFLVLLGGVGAYSQDRAKLERLNYDQMMKVTIAGVICNFIFVALAGVVWAVGLLDAKQLSMIANLNGSLVLFNMVPIWGLDGSKFMRAFFESVPEKREHGYVLGIMAVATAVFLLLTVVSRQAFVAPIFMLSWGLHSRSEEDDPRNSTNSKALSFSRERFWVYVYTTVLVAGSVMFALGRNYIA